MKSAVIVFPGSNCDRDCRDAVETATGDAPTMVWHRETSLPDGLGLIVIPGGFSYGDYLRCGAIAGRSPVMREVAAAAERGVTVVGICNGFQILCENQLLPGALVRNDRLTFVCRPERLEIANSDTRFTAAYGGARDVVFPVAHHDGNFRADEATLDRIEGEGQVVFRYTDNPNGSARDIAGVMNARGNVLGLMPHPDRAADAAHGGTDGLALFRSVMEAAA